MRIFLLVAFLSMSLTAFSQAGRIDQPSIGQASPVIFLSNRTGIEVVFYLETTGTAKTEHKLAANSSASYRGIPGDSFFNLEVFTSKDGQKVARKYGISIGERNHFEYRDGVVDLFKTPPAGR